MDETEFEQHADNFLQTVSTRFNLADLSFEEGSCLISFDGGNVMFLYPEPEIVHAIIMQVTVGSIPLDGDRIGELYLEFLHGNDAWCLTGGATLGVDRNTGEVSLWQRFTLPAVSEDDIANAMELHLGAADYWRGVIKQYGGEPELPDDEPSARDNVLPGPMLMA